MAWKKYDTVEALPSGLWDEKIAQGSAALDSRLIRVAERIFPRTAFEYGLRESGGRPSALILRTMKNGTASIGTPETCGLHFWLDEASIDRQAFLQEVSAMYGNDAKTLSFNYFTSQKAADWRDIFEKNGFRPVSALDLSTLSVPEAVKTLDEFPAALNAKYRYQWNRYRAAIDRENFGIEALTDYLPILDELYPLYIKVSERAEEYRAKPYPKDYFRIVKEEFGDDAVVVVIREKSTDEILGFMLLLYGQGSCVHQYIGLQRRDELFLWHNLTIESIGDALRRGIRRIDLGVTHAEAKRKFGAVNEKMFTFIR